ncbi:MAG: DUF58 domain-containing protein [Chloroflexi bacterium]|nr:DUF58 domain-containing protein [Chloroflexota bacterium]
MTQPLLAPSFLATLDQLVLVSRRARVGTFKGERRSPRRGGSVEFADYREYAPGDDFRQVDWNAYARMEKLFLRLFVEEEDATIHVVLDASASMQWGENAAGATHSKWHYAQRLAAALGYIALVGMDRLSAGAIATETRDVVWMRPLRGKAQALKFFQWLESIAPGGNASPQNALTQYAAQARRAGPLFLISDLMAEGWQRAVQRLSEQQYEITMLHLLSPDELEPALEGDLKLLDSEIESTGFAATVEVTADYDLLERYRTRVREWQSEWARYCAARNISYLPITTAQAFEELVLSFLRKHQILK